MFDSLRGRASGKNFLAYVVFGAICIVFVFWGIMTGLPGVSAGGSVAEVNDAIISIADFREEMRRMEQYLGNQASGPQADAMRQRLQQLARNNLINREVIVQNAKGIGVWVTDKEVRERIVNSPYFQQGGQFVPKYYRELLKANNMTPGEYEKIERKNALNNKVRVLFEEMMEPTPQEVERELVAEGTKVKVEYVKLEWAQIASPDKVGKSQLKSFIESEDGKKKINEIYQAQKDKFKVPEQVRVRQIMIAAKMGDEKSETEARKKVDKIREETVKGDFAELAKKYNEDPGTKDKAGDLGYFAKGRLDPNFEKVIFSMQLNEIKGPIKSGNGYHLVKLEEKKPERQLPVEEMQDQIARRVIAEQAAKDRMSELEKALAGGDDKAAGQVLKALKVDWKESEFLNLGQESFADAGEAGEEFVATAFSLSEERPLAKKLIRKGRDAFALRWKESQKAQALQDDKTGADDRVKSSISRQRSNDAFTRWLHGMRAQATIKVNNPTLR